MKAEDQASSEKGTEKTTKEGNRTSKGKNAGSGPGESSRPDRISFVIGSTEKALVEKLIKEKDFSLEQALECVSEVNAEIENQGLRDLTEDILGELVETKVQELRLRWNMAGENDTDLDSAIGDADFELSANAARVLERRYLKKDNHGVPLEAPRHMFRRVARTIAEVDRLYDRDADIKSVEQEFFRLMTGFMFVPNSPTLMNAGRELGQLSACFVIPIGDSLESIFEAVKHTALIHKSGGGTGFSFSGLRPHNDVVKSTSGVASGPISFMRVFDSATEEIKQGGTRRGANMGILNIDHPDIRKFIHCKEDTAKLTNFNISVGITEEFMRAVEDDRQYALKNPRTGEMVGTLSAREVFDEIVDAAWRTGEPGIVFLDRLNADNPTPDQGRIESTNPCGEQPLLPFESCNLGSINLAKVVRKGSVDWDRLGAVVQASVHFLDNVIDANRYPLKQIEDQTKKNRKIGLGLMGWADMLARLGIAYDSEAAIQLAEDVMLFIRNEGRKASAALAKKRGAFPAFETSIYNRDDQPPLRNATVTTIAPTGTISIIAGASSGIEPYFAISYTRTCMDNDELVEANPCFEAVARERGFYSEALMREVAKKGSIQGLDEIPEDVRRIFKTTVDISPEWHVKMQAAFQKYTDNAVSKTVNFPHNATREEIAEVYMLAYHQGCKGLTVYRDGARKNQVLTVNKEKEKTLTEEPGKRGSLKPRPRPDTIQGITRKIQTGCGSLYVTVNEDAHGMFEVFTNMGKAGGCAASQAEAVSRLISLALRAGIKTEDIVRQLKGISCPQIAWWQGKKILSCADALAKALELCPSYEKNGSKKVGDIQPAGSMDAHSEPHLAGAHSDQAGERPVFVTCPDCGAQAVAYGEGCVTCHSCGFTRC